MKNSNSVPATVLVVDDESSIREFLTITLQSHHYQTLTAQTGEEALEMASKHKPDVILLDWGLPGLTGVEVTRAIRRWTWTPIIFLSVRDDEETIVNALDAGADDYLCKPFRLPELLARLRACLRRKDSDIKEPTLVCGKLTLNLDTRIVTVSGKRVNLTPNEFGILQQLMIHQGKVVSHRQLLQTVWGESQAPETHILRVHVSNLRKKLEAFESLAEYLSNEPGIGYRLSAPTNDRLANC